MNPIRFAVLLALAGAAAPATGRFEPVPLGDPLLADVIVTSWANASSIARVEWTQFNPAAEAFTSTVPHPSLLTVPLAVNQIRAARPAQLDGDGATDWVLLVHRDPTGPTTVEHWEGNEIAMSLQAVLFTAGASAPIEAISVGDFDGDHLPDILAVTDLTGTGLDVLVHHEQQEAGGWMQVNEFPIGAAGSRIVAVTFGNLDGDAFVDVIVIREDEQARTSSLEHWESDGADLQFVATLVTEPMDTHRYRALDLGKLNDGEDADVLVVDWFFFETVHQVQRWEYLGGQLVLRSILEQRIAMIDTLVDVAIGSLCPAIDSSIKEPLPLVDPFEPPCLLWEIQLQDAGGFDAGFTGGGYVVQDIFPTGPDWAWLRLFRAVVQPDAFTCTLNVQWTQPDVGGMLDVRVGVFNAAGEVITTAGVIDAWVASGPKPVALIPGVGNVFGEELPLSGSGTVGIRGDGVNIVAVFDDQLIVRLCPSQLPLDARPNTVEVFVRRHQAFPFGSVSLEDFVLRQDVPCPWDLDGDGNVGITDFLLLLGTWGQSGVPSDIDCNGDVGIQDFLALLANWGPCV